jgi:hypothetical protein
MTVMDFLRSEAKEMQQTEAAEAAAFSAPTA